MEDNIPIAPCLCQHHGAAYVERTPPADVAVLGLFYEIINNGVTITSAQIITTKRCCIVVNAPMILDMTNPTTGIEIERPLGSVRTTQTDHVSIGAVNLLHMAAWEALPAGTYTYYIVNRTGVQIQHMGSWLKVVASDCDG